jgi:hypothetical protein
MRDTLARSVGQALDAALFSTAAGDASRPPGLLNGIAALTPSGMTPKSDAMMTDIAALVEAVAGVLGNVPVTIVAHPAQAQSLRPPERSGVSDVLASGVLPEGRVIAIASPGLISALDPRPRFELSQSGALHMEDTSPQQLASVGTPNAVAAPIRSLYQTDTSALRLVMEVSWGLRTSGAVAWMDAAW